VFNMQDMIVLTMIEEEAEVAEEEWEVVVIEEEAEVVADLEGDVTETGPAVVVVGEIEIEAVTERETEVTQEMIIGNVDTALRDLTIQGIKNHGIMIIIPRVLPADLRCLEHQSLRFLEGGVGSGVADFEFSFQLVPVLQLKESITG